ncbi:haloacid dehalogenase [Bombiscardovia apis]|uniref:Haloacid dehalogenase n=1 Tax=Bombiscardovia apis TaxID=2932182 RepID=A0ABN6SJT6_9BIFI|nr:HAD family phosphatase [Bombiscardovia apis]BDR54940.1 haloacid dehalogenase [Bombiscardovia apis]
MNGYPGEVELPADTIVATDLAETAQGKPIYNVIFDFGNVLVDWDPRAVFVARYSSESIEQMMDNDISGFYNANDMMNEGYSGEEAVAWVSEHRGEPWASMFQYYCDNMVDALTGPMVGARKLVEDLKAAGIGVWGLSNWSAETFPLVWERYEILHMLQGKVVSGYAHKLKPHTDIYELALEEFNIEADGAVFVDDLGVNILGANSAGIRGIRYEDPYGLRTALIESGIDIPQVQ